MEYVRIEDFDDYYYSCINKKNFYYSILHVYKWITLLLIFMYNIVATKSNIKPTKLTIG
jgi:hypothetical protein